jgi:hypothetical protein
VSQAKNLYFRFAIDIKQKMLVELSQTSLQLIPDLFKFMDLRTKRSVLRGGAQKIENYMPTPGAEPEMFNVSSSKNENKQISPETHVGILFWIEIRPR